MYIIKSDFLVPNKQNKKTCKHNKVQASLIYIYTYIKNTDWDNNIMSVMYLCVKRIITICL